METIHLHFTGYSQAFPHWTVSRHARSCLRRITRRDKTEEINCPLRSSAGTGA
jgi:hypothetical protein